MFHRLRNYICFSGVNAQNHGNNNTIQFIRTLLLPVCYAGLLLLCWERPAFMYLPFILTILRTEERNTYDFRNWHLMVISFESTDRDFRKYLGNIFVTSLFDDKKVMNPRAMLKKHVPQRSA